MSDAIPSPDDLPSDWGKGMSPPSTQPTPEQLMADPRVVALVDALEGYKKHSRRIPYNIAMAADNALAQLKGPKK
jgi:hypothetical protein